MDIIGITVISISSSSSKNTKTSNSCIFVTPIYSMPGFEHCVWPCVWTLANGMGRKWSSIAFWAGLYNFSQSILHAVFLFYYPDLEDYDLKGVGQTQSGKGLGPEWPHRGEMPTKEEYLCSKFNSVQVKNELMWDTEMLVLICYSRFLAFILI